MFCCCCYNNCSCYIAEIVRNRVYTTCYGFNELPNFLMFMFSRTEPKYSIRRGTQVFMRKVFYIFALLPELPSPIASFIRGFLICPLIMTSDRVVLDWLYKYRALKRFYTWIKIYWFRETLITCQRQCFF